MKSFALILLLSGCSSPDSNQATSNIPAKKSISADSLIAKIKKDDTYKVKSVEISRDSEIKITVSDPETFGTDEYFNKNYHLLDSTFIQEIAIYKGKKFLYGEGYHTAAAVTAFKEKNFIGDQCSTMNLAIKDKMNDPDSFEHISTDCEYQGSGTFQLTTIFRGKNAFNATVKNKAEATFDASGNILSIELVQ